MEGDSVQLEQFKIRNFQNSPQSWSIVEFILGNFRKSQRVFLNMDNGTIYFQPFENNSLVSSPQ